MKKEFSYEELKAAREILGLPEEATMTFIKERYRVLCRQYHPDVNQQDNASVIKMQEINNAYQLILDYCANYRYSFQQDQMRDEAAEWWQQRFGDDPMWGPGPKQGK